MSRGRFPPFGDGGTPPDADDLQPDRRPCRPEDGCAGDAGDGREKLFDAAMESAGVTLVKGDLTGIVRARKLSRAMMRKIKQNLFWAFAYNALGVPVAAGILYPFWGMLLSPMIVAASMSFSSVSVILNALRLRTVKIG
jgi:Cu+-exporting ATPase